MNMYYGLRGVRAAATLAVALVSTAVAGADQKPGTAVVQERASATIIEVPVTVLGKDGSPLVGLGIADFEVLDNGKKQQITGFDVADLRARSAVQSSGAFSDSLPPVARRHWLLVFDLSYASATALVRARDGARAFVEGEMTASDLCGVATLSVESGWKLLVNFTNDRAQLAQAIDTLGVVKTGVRTSDPLSFAFVPPTQGGIENERAGGPPAANAKQVLLESLQDVQNLQRQSSDSQERGRVAQQVGSLGKMAQLLDSVRGRKYVLLFSEGFESRLITGNAGKFASPLGETSATQDTAAESAVKGEIWKIDNDARMGSSATRGFLEDAMTLFRRADVVLNTVDISGLRADREVTSRTASGTDALFTMANDTNGELIRNANQLSGDLQRMIDRTAIVYVLAFQPRLTKPGEFHELKVRIRGPATRIVCRSGYYEPRPYKSLSPIERALSSGDLLTGGGRSDLSLDMITAPFAAGPGVLQLPVILEVPGKPLIGAGSALASQLQIYAYASDASGKLADYLTQEMSLDLAKLRARLEAGGIKFYGTLYVAPGKYIVRLLVRDVSTGRSGLATAFVSAPSVPGGDATVLPPFFQQDPPADSWIMVRATARPKSLAGAAGYPFVVEGNSFIPAARPVLSATSRVQVVVMTFNMEAAGAVEPLQVVAEVLGSDGKARNVVAQVVGRSNQEPDGRQAFIVDLNPGGLEPGSYMLTVRVSDRSSRRTSAASSPFEVRAP